MLKIRYLTRIFIKNTNFSRNFCPWGETFVKYFVLGAGLLNEKFSDPWVSPGGG